MRKKDSRTNPRDAKPAGISKRTTEAAAVDNEKCLTPFAPPAERIAKFRSSQEMIALFIAVIVFPTRDRICSLKYALGRIFCVFFKRVTLSTSRQYSLCPGLSQNKH